MSPDRRRHRGAHPADHVLFSEEYLPRLQAAVGDVSWLLSRGYALRSAADYVSGHHGLADRQRRLVVRAACSVEAVHVRSSRRLPATALRGHHLCIDALNVLISLEAALSGGLLFRCRDGCLRDLSGVHGTYRMVEETGEAIRLVAEALIGFGVGRTAWVVDRPVSNSGRLADLLRAVGREQRTEWEVLHVSEPDDVLRAWHGVVSTADSVILDRTEHWFDLVSDLVPGRVPEAWIIDLGTAIPAV